MEPTRSLRPFLIAAGLCLAWVAFLAFFGPSDPTGMSPPQLLPSAFTTPADFTWPLLDLDDKPTDLARFKGRPMVLNVWATWCPPCRAEMPALAGLAADPKFKAIGGTVVCVSVDESSGTIRQFLQGKDWGMTMLRATSTPPAFATNGIPATFLIAPDGQVVANQIGSAKWDDPSVVEFLERFGPRKK